jgi:hypothetical protein
MQPLFSAAAQPTAPGSQSVALASGELPGDGAGDYPFRLRLSHKSVVNGCRQLHLRNEAI